MGSGSSIQYTWEDGQNMAFNRYPSCKSRNRPISEHESQVRDPDGSREKMLIEIRVADLKAKEKYNN